MEKIIWTKSEIIDLVKKFPNIEHCNNCVANTVEQGFCIKCLKDKFRLNDIRRAD